MNYKKILATMLALSMCVPIVASNGVSIFQSVNVSATANPISYENVYSYNTELDVNKEDSGFRISNLEDIDTIQVTVFGLEANTPYDFSFNKRSGDTWSYANPYFYQVSTDDKGSITLTINTKDCDEIYSDSNYSDLLNVTAKKGTRTAIKEINTMYGIGYNDAIDTTGYDTLVATMSYNGALDGKWFALDLKDTEDNILTSDITGKGVWFNATTETFSTATSNAFDISEINQPVYVNNTSEDARLQIYSIQLSKDKSIPNFDTFGLCVNETTTDLSKYDTIQSIAVKEGSPDDLVEIGTDNSIKGLKTGETTLILTYVDGTKQEVPVTVSTLELNVTEKTIQSGETANLKAEVKSGIPTSWASSDEEVATVDENGVVTPKKEGTTTITATDKFGNTAKVEIKVTSKEVVNVAETNLHLETTDTYQIEVTNGTTPKEYVSSDEKVVTVDENGLITAVGEGSTTIKVVSKDGVETTITVNVTNPKPVEVKAEKTTMVVGESTTLSKVGGIVKQYTSSDDTIATVDQNGTVKALKVGDVTITATDKIGRTSKVDIKVVPFTVNRTTLNLGVKDTYTIKSDVSKVTSYTSKDEKVATVDEKGVVTGLSVGSTTVTVKDEFGNVAEVSVNVFGDTDYQEGKSEVKTNEDGQEYVEVSKGDATEVKLELSSKPYTVANGVLSYWDNETSKNVTFDWYAEFDKDGKATVYVGELPKEVTTLVFTPYYSAYWDNETSSMVDAKVSVVSVSGNSTKEEVPETPTVKVSDLLLLKKHILGISTVKDISTIDYYQDQAINVLDLIYAKKILLGLIK